MLIVVKVYVATKFKIRLPVSPEGHPERSHFHSRRCKPYWWTLRPQQEPEAEREPHGSHHESIRPLLHPGGRLQRGTPVLSTPSCAD